MQSIDIDFFSVVARIQDVLPNEKESSVRLESSAAIIRDKRFNGGTHCVCLTYPFVIQIERKERLKLAKALCRLGPPFYLHENEAFFSAGGFSMSQAVFLDACLVAEIDLVHVYSFGDKIPCDDAPIWLLDKSVSSNNIYHIGLESRFPDFIPVVSVYPKGNNFQLQECKIHPMFGILGKGSGRFTCKGTSPIISISVHPSISHSLKSCFGGYAKIPARSEVGVKRLEQSVVALLRSVGKEYNASVCGLRVEVEVIAGDCRDAIELAKPFLTIENLHNMGFSFDFISKSEYVSALRACSDWLPKLWKPWIRIQRQISILAGQVIVANFLSLIGWTTEEVYILTGLLKFKKYEKEFSGSVHNVLRLWEKIMDDYGLNDHRALEIYSESENSEKIVLNLDFVKRGKLKEYTLRLVDGRLWDGNFGKNLDANSVVERQEILRQMVDVVQKSHKYDWNAYFLLRNYSRSHEDTESEIAAAKENTKAVEFGKSFPLNEEARENLGENMNDESEKQIPVDELSSSHVMIDHCPAPAVAEKLCRNRTCGQELVFVAGSRKNFSKEEDSMILDMMELSEDWRNVKFWSNLGDKIGRSPDSLRGRARFLNTATKHKELFQVKKTTGSRKGRKKRRM